MKMTKRDKIRKDLWFAVLNYSAPSKYVWTGAEAVQAPAEDVRPTLPTLTEEQFRGWKRDFIDAGSRLFPSDRDRLQRWAEENLPTAALPQGLRASWNEKLKYGVLARLRQWFEEHDIPVPRDLLEREGVLPPAKAAPGPPIGHSHQSPLDRVRALTAECIRQMSWKELSELRIPATAWARVAGVLGDEKSLDMFRSGAEKSEPRQSEGDQK